MQVKGSSAPGSELGSVGRLSLVDDENVRSLTAWQQGPQVMVTIPVSVELLHAACSAETAETAEGIAAMTDEMIRSYSVAGLLTQGVVEIHRTNTELAAQPQTAEAAAYLAAVQERLTQALDPARLAVEAAATEAAAAAERATGDSWDGTDGRGAPAQRWEQVQARQAAVQVADRADQLDEGAFADAGW